MRIIIDLRCLQDPDFATRGIGRHARGFITRRPPVPGPVIGLVDPLMPMPAADILANFDSIRPNAYFPDLGPEDLFLNPSPMTADPLFTARLAGNPAIRRVAVVYDFIPFDDQPRYLHSRTARLRYLTALAWLRKYDFFLPISEATQLRLNELFGTPRSVVAGVPLPDGLRPGENAEGRHILAVAGNDPRKNAESVIRAHAASKFLQARRIPLVVTGEYPPEIQAQFRDLAQQAGGDPALLDLLGHVSDALLYRHYQDAICVVTASRAEGFSLPVIEAMAAGVPSIASDIPAHAMLVKDPELRFQPDDSDRLGAMLERIASSPEYCAEIIAAQAGIWPAFEAKTVAAKIWSAIMSDDIPAKVTIGGSKPRIAILSPFPPARSGVADYSAACVAALSRHAKLALFSGEENPDPVAGIKIGKLLALPHMTQKFDRVISVLGNSHYHSGIYDLLARYGAAAICHDSRLLHFHIGKHGSRVTAAIAARELRREVAEAELDLWAADETQREATLLGEAARFAQPLIFHAKASVELVRQRFNVNARYLPFAIDRSWPQSVLDTERKQDAKRRLGLDPSRTHLASFGFLTAAKASRPALEALLLLVQSGIPAHLHFVGEPGAFGEPILAKAAELGLQENISLATGFLTETRYRNYLLAADIGLQLRNSGPGSISGGLKDCIAAGLPTVANETLAAALDAPSYVTRIPDRLAPSEIATALAQHIENPPALTAEWQEYCDSRSMAKYASRLCEILELEI